MVRTIVDLNDEHVLIAINNSLLNYVRFESLVGACCHGETLTGLLPQLKKYNGTVDKAHLQRNFSPSGGKC